MSAYLRSALLVSATCWLLAPHVISGQSRPAEEASHRKTVGTKKHKNSGTFILVGAGDIASCEALEGAEATAKLIDGIPGEVFAAGDLAYESGTVEEFNNCYDKTWGRFKNRTHPAPGNHEFYGSKDGSPYFDYWGAQAGEREKGYYSLGLLQFRSG